MVVMGICVSVFHCCPEKWVFNNPISGIILAGVLGEVVTKITLLSILAIIFYSANSFSN
jgi:hypothetical protein